MNLGDLAISTDELTVEKGLCAIEAAFDIFIQISGLCIVYAIFSLIGRWLIGSEFSPDILLSLVVLPAILVLKKLPSIAEPYFVKVSLNNNTLSVKQGILTKFEDSLNLSTVENIEVITTYIGRFKGYSTLRVYAYGSWVEVPNVNDAHKLKAKIEKVIMYSKPEDEYT